MVKEKVREKKFHSGWVGLIGPTNAGKSTLLNRLIGEKIAIVTPKPQTTRHDIKGIFTDTSSQIIFCDTPGLHESTLSFNQEMLKIAFETLKEMDVVCVVMDAAAPEWQWLSLAPIRTVISKSIVIFNKADLLSPPQRESILGDYDHQYFDAPSFFVSAVTGEGTASLLEFLKAHLPEGPLYYPEDEVTDRDWRFLAAEIVREKCFLLLKEELPYGLTVIIDAFKEGRVVEIDATIIVNRDSQKGMVIGKGGATIKKIGQLAREDLERQLDQKVMLKTFVRVEKNWIKDERKIQEFVYPERKS